MKGVSYITDDKKKSIKALIIDMEVIEKHDEDVHELIDTLVAESRRNEEKISWDLAKKQLKSKTRK